MQSADLSKNFDTLERDAIRTFLVDPEISNDEIANLSRGLLHIGGMYDLRDHPSFIFYQKGYEGSLYPVAIRVSKNEIAVLCHFQGSLIPKLVEAGIVIATSKLHNQSIQ